MSINQVNALNWLMARKGVVTYSMTYRNGPASFDCSSAIYFALRSGGASDNGWAVNTEYEHDWLVKNGYELIAENSYWEAKKYDIFIWGKRGASSGAGGHTGMFINENDIIHCNYGYNSITVNNHDEIWNANGQPYVYAYRYTGRKVAQNETTAMTKARSQFEHELNERTRLTNKDTPYYEATLSEDYYVESKPDANSKDKELLKAGTTVRVYEKINGWSRIGAPQSNQWVEDSYLIDAKDM